MVSESVGKINFLMCSRYVNASLVDVRLNCKQLGEMDCYKYVVSQVITNGGCDMYVSHRMNESINSGER